MHDAALAVRRQRRGDSRSRALSLDAVRQSGRVPEAGAGGRRHARQHVPPERHRARLPVDSLQQRDQGLERRHVRGVRRRRGDGRVSRQRAVLVGDVVRRRQLVLRLHAVARLLVRLARVPRAQRVRARQFAWPREPRHRLCEQRRPRGVRRHRLPRHGGGLGQRRVPALEPRPPGLLWRQHRVLVVDRAVSEHDCRRPHRPLYVSKRRVRARRRVSSGLANRNERFAGRSVFAQRRIVELLNGPVRKGGGWSQEQHLHSLREQLGRLL